MPAPASASDPRVDAYIRQARPFAQPILKHLRKTLHATEPGLTETIKWGAPAYELDGKLVCFTASFNAHCSLSFWPKAMEAYLAEQGIGQRPGMGQLGKLTDIKDLPPPAQLKRFVKKAVTFTRSDQPGRPEAATRKPPARTPSDLAAALARSEHAAAKATWDQFTPAKRRDYIEWITTAKREATRAKRLTTTLEWLAEGKPRNWKYQNC